MSPPSAKRPTQLHFKDVVEKVIANHEGESKAHQVFRSYPGHNKAQGLGSQDGQVDTVPGVVSPGATGVIYCTDRAMANGFTYSDTEWANLGQGAPETGPLPDAPPRPQSVSFSIDSLEYGPTTGVKELREAVANLYNVEYREAKRSKYTAENVCIVPGGRAGLTRVAACIGDVYTAYQVPDYTAYSEMLSVFKRLVPIPTALEAEKMYNLDLNQVKKDIKNQGVQVILASNPRNPTGQVIAGTELSDLVELGRQKTTVILDEFYSWYLYPEQGKEDTYEFGEALSAAKYVEDVDKDSVIIIDGLTKNFRLPGWRVCWVVGPKELIRALSQSGSFLDGGANHPLQLAAVPLLDPEHVHKEKIALQRHFLSKRNHVLDRLEKMNLKIHLPPRATFYIWLDLAGLPHPLDNGLTFFEELLKEKVIVVPGIFFDINPAHRRDLFASPCHHFVRISFGPSLEVLDKGLDAMERLMKRIKHEGMDSIGQDYAKSPIQLEFAQRWGDAETKPEDGAKSVKDKVVSLFSKGTS